KVDPGRLRVQATLAPLTELDSPRTVRTDRGDLAVVTYELDTACLDERCVSDLGPVQLRFAPVQVAVPRRGGGTVSVQAPWPGLFVRGRVVPRDIRPAKPPFQRDVAPPPVTYRLGPSGLALALEVLAAVLAAAGVGLAGRELAGVVHDRRRRNEQRGEMEVALALAREAESRPPRDRRRALGLLARLLE